MYRSLRQTIRGVSKRRCLSVKASLVGVPHDDKILKAHINFLQTRKLSAFKLDNEKQDDTTDVGEKEPELKANDTDYDLEQDRADRWDGMDEITRENWTILGWDRDSWIRFHNII